MIKKIKLTQGKYALVSKADFERVNEHKWCYSHGYAVRRIKVAYKKYKNLYMHRFLMDAQKAQIVDHKNMNPLDNSRPNLRLATKSQNLANQGMASHNTSGYKGAVRVGDGWMTQISINNKNVRIGIFLSKEEAAAAHNAAAIAVHGDYARLNSL